MAFKRSSLFFLHQITPLVFGLLLLVAGANSIIQSFTLGLETSTIVSVPLNLIVGALLVVAGDIRWVRVLGCLLFSLYCAYLAINLINGRVACNCLGAGTPATLMLVVDILGATFLGILSIKRQGLGTTDVAKKELNFSALGMLIGMLIFGSLFAGASQQFRATLLVVDAELDTDAPSSDLKAIALVVENKSSKDVRIYGVERNCQLISVSDFPIDLKPGQKGRIQIRLRHSGLGKSIQYLDRGVITMFVSQEFDSVGTLPAFWFLKKS